MIWKQCTVDEVPREISRTLATTSLVLSHFPTDYLIDHVLLIFVENCITSFRSLWQSPGRVLGDPISPSRFQQSSIAQKSLLQEP